MTRPWRRIMTLFIASILSAASRNDRIAPEETPCSSGVPRPGAEIAPAGATAHPARTATTTASRFLMSVLRGTPTERPRAGRSERNRPGRPVRVLLLHEFPDQEECA